MSESEISFPPYLKYIIAVAIAVITVWVLIKVRMEAIREKLEALKKDHDVKKSLLDIAVIQKEQLDRQVLKSYRIVVSLIVLFLGLATVAVCNIVGWTVGEWSDFLGVSTLLGSVAVFLVLTAFKSGMSFQSLIDALYRNVEASVYRKAGFDVNTIKFLRAELVENRRQCRLLNKELKNLDRCVPF